MKHFRLATYLFVLGLMALAACQAASAPPTTAPSVPTAVAPLAATAVPPTAAPTTAPAQALTTFSPKTFKLPMTLSYGADWKIVEDLDQLYMKNNQRKDGWELGFNLVTHAKIADPDKNATIPWPQDFVAYLHSNPHIKAGEPKPVTVGGVKGIQIDAYAEKTGERRILIDLASSDWLYLDYEEMWRFVMLENVNGERVLITLTVDPATNELPVFAEIAQQVLDTVVFIKPTAAQAQTTFSSKTFKLPMSVSFSSEWAIDEDYDDLITVKNKEADFSVAFNLVNSAQIVDPATGALLPFPQDFITWIRSNPDFKTGLPTQVTIAGYEGMQIDATPSVTKNTPFLHLSGTGWQLIPDPEQWRFIMLDDVNGERLLIMLIAPADKFQDLLPQAQSILQSVVLKSTSLEPVDDQPTAKVLAEWKINMPEDIVFGFDSVWVPSRRSPQVTTRIDPVTNKVVAVIKGTGMYSKSAVVTKDAVWVAGQISDLAAIDPKTNTVGTKVPGNHPRIAYAFDSIWAVGHQGEPLDRVDPVTGKIIASIPLDGKVSDAGEENGVIVTASAVWVIANGELIKIDPTTNSVVMRTTLEQVVEEAKAQTSVPAGKGTDFMWLILNEGLVRIDPNSGKGLGLLATVHGDIPIAVTDDVVWVADDKGILTQVNVATNQIDAAYKISPGASRVALGLGSVWLAYSSRTLVQRLDIAP